MSDYFTYFFAIFFENAVFSSKISKDNLESDSKVVLLTIVEALVLLALGIYQVLALRRFFIVKNLY